MAKKRHSRRRKYVFTAARKRALAKARRALKHKRKHVSHRKRKHASHRRRKHVSHRKRRHVSHRKRRHGRKSSKRRHRHSGGGMHHSAVYQRAYAEMLRRGKSPAMAAKIAARAARMKSGAVRRYFEREAAQAKSSAQLANLFAGFGAAGHLAHQARV
jgi:hypothetical protein